MDVTARFARRFRYLVMLEGSLVLGAAYDLAFAVAALAKPGPHSTAISSIL